MHLPSPGVERAVAAALTWSARLGAPEVRLVDYALGLLDEEDGHPAVLLERLGFDLTEARATLAAIPPTIPAAPPLARLYDAARDWSIAHRADPAFMTDAFLLAILLADPPFWQAVPRFERLADQIEERLATADGLIHLSGWHRHPAGVASVAPARSRCHPDNDAPAAFALPEPTAEMDAARVLDANFNRSREALRVLEDYCRFVLDDRFLTEQVKAARHGLAEAAMRLPPGLLLAGRDTLGDIGTTVTAAGEYDRGSPAQVAAANLKRLQESLRSLEEFGKLFGSELGRELEAIRYRTYTLERAIVLCSTSREKLKHARLYVLLTGSQCATSLDWLIAQAAAGGANVFQLREKELPDRELIERARNVRRWTRTAGVLFIVNDRPDISRLVEADGVHLGQDDLPVKLARRILGPNALIGVSTHSIDQVRRAVLDGADYLGIGPTFPSKTKDFAEFPGLDLVRSAAAETSLPAFALGGIGPDNIGAVVAAGGRRVAVSSCIAGSDDPESVARILRAALGG